MTIYLSLLVAVAGLLIYGYASNPKASEAGRVAFFCGLLVFLLQSAPHVVSSLR